MTNDTNQFILRASSYSKDALLTTNYRDDYIVRGNSFANEATRTVTAGTEFFVLDASACDCTQVFKLPIRVNPSSGTVVVNLYEGTDYEAGSTEVLSLINRNRLSSVTAGTVLALNDTVGTDKGTLLLSGLFGTDSAFFNAGGGFGESANALILDPTKKYLFKLLILDAATVGYKHGDNRNMNLITTDTLKTLLGITSTEYDSTFELMIPIVSADVRRILNNQFNETVDCDITSGSNVIENIYDVNALYDSFGNEKRFAKHDYLEDVKLNNGLDIGRVIVSDCFEDETYIVAYDEYNAKVTVSSEATADGDELITSVSIAQFPTIAKMVWYKISQMNSNAINSEVSSKSMGSVSVTYATNINKKWNYPQQLINDLGTPLAKVN